MVVDDPRTPFLASLDIPSCRIVFTNQPIVLLCGGFVPGPKPAPDSPDPPIASLRHAITNAHPSFEIFRPEEIQNWHSDAVFKDLVSFERELASICSLIVIVVESPGSMVELGAFSQLEELAEKSIVICSSRFVDDFSFINLGILRFMRSKVASRVKSYPWEIDRPNEISNEVVNDVVSDVCDELKKLPKTAVFGSEHYSHCMVMITELLRYFVALKEQEIIQYLSACGFAISSDQLRGKLFLLKSFRIVRTETYSDATFYVLGEEMFHRLRLAAKDREKTIDSLRIEVLCLDFYASDQKQKNRHRAIMQLRKGGTR
jgi:hypothetical protein